MPPSTATRPDDGWVRHMHLLGLHMGAVTSMWWTNTHARMHGETNGPPKNDCSNRAPAELLSNYIQSERVYIYIYIKKGEDENKFTYIYSTKKFMR